MYGYLTSSGNMDGCFCSPRTENQDGNSGATLQNPLETSSLLRWFLSKTLKTSQLKIYCDNWYIYCFLEYIMHFPLYIISSIELILLGSEFFFTESTIKILIGNCTFGKHQITLIIIFIHFHFCTLLKCVYIM